MITPYSISSLGDQAVFLEFEGNEIDQSVHEALVTMKHWIEAHRFAGLLDVILGYRSIAISYDFHAVSIAGTRGSVSESVKGKLEQAYLFASQNKRANTSRQRSIPVCYSDKFGLDLKSICERNKISVGELISLHTNISYKVYLIGFLPGFPYLGFVDSKLEMPRHQSPRPVVPAGSVGIAGKQTGIYPFDSPGGWQIIGRTPVKLFDPTADPPVKLEAGDVVTFYSIDEREFDHFKTSNHDQDS